MKSKRFLQLEKVECEFTEDGIEKHSKELLRKHMSRFCEDDESAIPVVKMLPSIF